MCVHNACDSESLCACCRRYGPDHDESVCAPITQQLRMEADGIRNAWRGNEPPLWNQSAWHHWKNEMRRVEVLERAAAAIEDARAELSSCTAKLGSATIRMVHYMGQRDEARRQYCSLIEFGKGDGTSEAKSRGWDCFKENKP